MEVIPLLYKRTKVRQNVLAIVQISEYNYR